MERSPQVSQLLAQANAARIRESLFYLSKDPLPYRKVNFTRPGQTKTTLDETDDFVQTELRAAGWEVKREPAQAQAFRCDTSKHPSHWYSLPEPSDPWHTVYDLSVRKTGAVQPEQTIVVVSHKDSPSWIDCPGANDNAAGASCNLEVARLLASQALRKSLWLLFCNEEHWPWTSVAQAQNAKARGEDLIAVLNLDGTGGRSPEDKAAGRHVSSAIYGTPEGECLADLLEEVNRTYDLGLIQGKRFREQPGNDDGSFLKAGFPAAIGIHGSLDYENPTYHRPEDVPERLDPETICRVAQLVTAVVVTLDRA